MSFSSLGSRFFSALKALGESVSLKNLDLPLDFNAEAYLELNPDLDTGRINPFQHFASIGKKEGRKYKSDGFAKDKVHKFELPEDFSPEEYRNLHPDLAHFKGDLVQHYLDHGAPELRKYLQNKPAVVPNTERYRSLPVDFDPELYLEFNQDIIGHPLSPYDHYVEYGLFEERPYRAPLMIPCLGKPQDPSKPAVLIVSHEATRTGAPILSWNIAQQLSLSHNVIILLLEKGSLLANFQQDAMATYSAPGDGNNKNILAYFVRHLVKIHSFEFAILNSIETSNLCQPLTLAGVPNLLLIHEFAANTRPTRKFSDALVWSSVPVFSTQLTKQDAARIFPGPIFENALVIPQGRCAIPPNLTFGNAESFSGDGGGLQVEEIVAVSRKLVVGIGSVCIRKGIDIFIEAASQMQAQAGRDTFEFLWVGGGYPDYDPEYSAFLADQIQRSGLTGHINIVSETDNLDALYQRAALLLLTSRLDPLPNIAIDAICLGLPLVCFAKASGIADVLIENGLEALCVARYIDPSDMAKKALHLLADTVSTQVGHSLRVIGESSFSLPKYCHQLVALQSRANSHIQEASRSVKALIDGKYFDATYYHGSPPQTGVAAHSETEYCWDYVMTTRAGNVVRKPVVGFNPLVYRERLGLDILVEPVTHYLSAPKDERYQAPAIISPASNAVPEKSTALRLALHIHAFYIDLLPDILDRLLKNATQVAIFITVDSDENKELVANLLDKRNTEQASISVCPNRGRDVYPFLMTFEEMAGNYDVIGHVHTKRSPHVKDGSNLVSRWRNLLLGNLLGSEHCPNMMDRVTAHFSTHLNTDIVFPDDPHVIGWTKNVNLAREMLPEHVFDTLPKNFDFPVGTMFWARSHYLSTISEMDVQHRFTPKEPLAIDGTVLHAWERLLGAMAATPTPRYALTYVPGLNR